MTTTTRETANTYQTFKHNFEGFPNDSTTCRFCQRSFTDDLHCNVPERPATAECRWTDGERVFIGTHQFDDGVCATCHRTQPEQALGEQTLNVVRRAIRLAQYVAKQNDEGLEITAIDWSDLREAVAEANDALSRVRGVGQTVREEIRRWLQNQQQQQMIAASWKKTRSHRLRQEATK